MADNTNPPVYKKFGTDTAGALDGSYVNEELMGSSQDEGQVSSRTTLLAHVRKNGTERVYTIIGGISDGNIQSQNQSIPITEIGSDKFLMVIGRQMPGYLQMNKMYVNNKNLIASLVDAADSRDGAADRPDFIINLARRELKKPQEYMIFIYNMENVSSTELAAAKLDVHKIVSATQLKGAVLENYNLSIMSDQVVISESCGMRIEEINPYEFA